MMLRPHRRNLVIWSSSANLADRYGGLRFTRLARRRPIRWCMRNGALLAVIGLVGLARGLAEQVAEQAEAVVGVLVGAGAAGCGGQ